MHNPHSPILMAKIRQLVSNAKHILVVQADNPDADSLGSALALEHVFGDIGKEVSLYCGVNIPDYLHYLDGWDRVYDELPKQFDLSVIVDTSTYTLLEKLQTSNQLSILKTRPCIVLDHHATVEQKIDFADVELVDGNAASTGEIIFRIASDCKWPVSAAAADRVMASILGDTQGLTNELTKASTYRTMAELCELGANRPKLEELRREYSKMVDKVYRYKGLLLQRTDFLLSGRVAMLHIPQSEINEYSPLYNPAALVQFDMLQVRGVVVAVVLKSYDDGRVTAAIRANNGFPIASRIAEILGGGGHDYAAGFKVTDGRNVDQVRAACLEAAENLLGQTD